MTDNIAPQYKAMICDGLPTSCVRYGVVDTVTGKEVCRVWGEGDCRKITELLNEVSKPRPTRQEARVLLAAAFAELGLSGSASQIQRGAYNAYTSIKLLLDEIAGEE